MSYGERASFLGIPLELRHRIYDQTIFLGLDRRFTCTTDSADLKFRVDPDEFFSTAVGTAPLVHVPSTHRETTEPRVAEAETAVAWVSLRMTCRQIASEMDAYMQSSAVAKSEEHRTCKIVLGIFSAETMGVTLKAGPCVPADISILQVDVQTYQQMTIWDAREFLPIAQQLFLLLDRFARCGPSFDTSRPLVQRIKLGKIHIEIAYKLAFRQEDEFPASTAAVQPAEEWLNRSERFLGYTDWVTLTQKLVVNYGQE